MSDLYITMFTCERCHQEFKQKQHLKSHLTKKKVCPPTHSIKSREVLLDKLKANKTEKSSDNSDKYVTCNKCTKSFYHSNISRHLKSCKGEKTKAQETLESNLADLIDKKIKDALDKVLNVGTSGTSIVNGSNVNSHNTTNVVNINNFGSETYDHLSSDFIRSCLINQMTGMKELIKQIHFSEECPQNNNVRVRSLKHELVEVKKDDKWVPTYAHEAMDLMIRKGYRVANRYYLDNNNNIQEYDINELDMRIQNFLLTIMDKTNTNYFALRKRILALILEHGGE